MVYLYLLLTEASRPLLNDREKLQAMLKKIELSYHQALREEVNFLGGQVVSGKLPTYPDEYVVTTCLMLCNSKNIDFNSNRDEISYSVDTLAGIPVGTCKITIKHGSDN